MSGDLGIISTIFHRQRTLLLDYRSNHPDSCICNRHYNKICLGAQLHSPERARHLWFNRYNHSISVIAPFYYCQQFITQEIKFPPLNVNERFQKCSGIGAYVQGDVTTELSKPPERLFQCYQPYYTNLSLKYVRLCQNSRPGTVLQSRLVICVLSFGWSQNKQLLFPHTSLTDWIYKRGLTLQSPGVTICNAS